MTLLQRIGEAYHALFSFGWLSRWLTRRMEGRPYVTAGVIGLFGIILLWLRFSMLDRYRRGVESENLMPGFVKYVLEFLWMFPLAIFLALVFSVVFWKLTEWRQRGAKWN